MDGKPAWTPGRFVWRELATADPAAAVGFYGELLGWQAETLGEPGPGSYTLLSLDGSPVCGVNPLPPGSGDESRWVPFASVGDVDEVVRASVELGAAVRTEPLAVPGFGRLAVLADPQGAEVALFRRDDGDPPQAGVMRRGFAWEELRTPEPEQATAFYHEALGWGATTYDIRGFGRYWVFARDGRDRAGMMPSAAGVPARWLSHVIVDDLEATLARAEALGGARLEEPVSNAVLGRLVVLADPVGALFVLYEPLDDAGDA